MRAFILSGVLMLGACGQGPQVACGPGTQEVDGVCVTVSKPEDALLIDGIEGKSTNQTNLSWTVAPTPREDTLHDLLALKDSLYAVGDNGTLLISKDTGRTWQVKNSGTSNHLYDIDKAGAQLFTCGAKGTVKRSLENDLWEDLTIVDTGDLFHVFAEGGALFVVGQAGTIARYNKESEGWDSPQKATDKDLYTFARLNQTFWAAGQSGTILNSKGGSIWEAETVGAEDFIYLRELDGAMYAVARDGSVYKNDKQWKKIVDGVPGVVLSDVWGEDDSWLAVGADGVILQSEMLGKPWKRSPSGVTTNLRGAYGNASLLFASGEGGAVLHLAPWNVWVSNSAAVGLRLRFGERATIVPKQSTRELSVTTGQVLFEYVDEEANVYQQTFSIEENKTYKLLCAPGKGKQLECDDLTSLEDTAKILPL